MIALGLVPFSTAIATIDMNVIFLLVGMMTSVHILSKTGFFEFMAVKIAQMAKGEPIRMMLFFLVLTAVLSAFLDNVTTVILLAPVTILIAQLLEISAVPFLILEAIASNIGGTSTLIGDPPNIIIGSQAGLTFNEFIVNLGSVIFIVMIVFLLTIFLIFRRRWNVPEKTKAKVLQAVPELAIIDRPNMIKSLIIFMFIFAGFFTHHMTSIEPG
jgi:Na+/H+ antiporter NhaD/arsenite permease-like protein